jgi:hypothetical protein
MNTRTCPHANGRKLSYATRREAEIAAWQVLARGGKPTRSYACHACHGWHLTRWPEKASTVREGRR